MKERDDFNFDEWAALAATDPAAFEAKRRAVLKAKIDAIPDSQAHVREKLTKLLLEQGPQSSETPMQRTVEAFNLMQESMLQLVTAHGSLLRSVSNEVGEKVEVPALPAAQRFTRLVSE